MSDLYRKINMSNHVNFVLFYVLFFFSGRFKAAYIFQNIPIDLSAFFLVCCFCFIIKDILIDGNKFSKEVLLTGSLFLLFCLYAGLSLLWGMANSHIANVKLAKLIFICGFILFGAIYIVNNKKYGLDLLLKYIFYFCLIYTVFSLPITGFDIYNSHSLPKILGSDYIGVSRVLCIGVVLLLFKNFLNIKKRLLLLCIFTVYLLMCGGRGPLIFLFLILVFLLPITLKAIKYEAADIISNFTLFNIFAFLTFLVVLFGLYNNNMLQTVSRFSGFSEHKYTHKIVSFIYKKNKGYEVGSGVDKKLPANDTHKNEKKQTLEDVVGLEARSQSSTLPGGVSGAVRIIYYRTAIKQWLEYPFFGGGIGSFSQFAGLSHYTYPHNIILEILAELGILGMLLYMLMFSISFLAILLCRKQLKENGVILIILFLFSFLNMLISGSLVSNRLPYMLMGISSVCLVWLKENKFFHGKKRQYNRLIKHG